MRHGQLCICFTHENWVLTDSDWHSMDENVGEKRARVRNICYRLPELSRTHSLTSLLLHSHHTTDILRSKIDWSINITIKTLQELGKISTIYWWYPQLPSLLESIKRPQIVDNCTRNFEWCSHLCKITVYLYFDSSKMLRGGFIF